MNVPRLAARNRLHWREGGSLIERVGDPRLKEALLDWQQGGVSLGAVIDLNDRRGRATSAAEMAALNRETAAWLERLPELPERKTA